MSIFEYNEEAVLQMLGEDKREEGRLENIKIVIEICKEFGASREETLLKLQEKFDFSEKVAEDYLKQHWI